MGFSHVRTIVSGHKARYIDAETNINLDLVYGEFQRQPSSRQSRTES